LQGALEGKENLLQELEQRSAKEAQAEAGGGRGGGRQDFWRLLTGGGGGGDGEWDPRKKIAKHKQTLQAVLLLVAGVAAFFLWKPALAFLVNLIFFCLRIPDGRDASLQINYDLTAEEDVIRRWGGAHFSFPDAPFPFSFFFFFFFSL